MESVWQYLKIYSLWQENVPDNAFHYDSPEIMLDKIHDTLKGNNPYTHYDSSCGACRATTGQNEDQSGESVYWDSLSYSTMYLRISRFIKTTYQDFLSAVIMMGEAHDFRNIIIDLLSNGGGDIAVTDSIIEAILPAHTPYLIETYRHYDQQSRQAKTVVEDTQITEGPQHWALKNKRYALLVNKFSASASEMLIAALRDGFSQKANGDTVVIIGDTTYGKGIGQICIARQYLGHKDLKITFMRMKGLAKTGDYHRKGIAPDIVSVGEDREQQVFIALKLFEPKALLNKQLLRIRNDTTLPNHFPSEAVIMAPADDRPVW
jgi:C-terminal processing protease CtpA/Prc